MPAYGEHSLRELLTADPRFAQIFNEVSKLIDNSIIDGIRSVDQQKKNVAAGLSKTMDSKHLPDPKTGLSDAVDAAPYPQLWDDKTKPAIATQWEIDQIYFAGIVVGIAHQMGIPLRWGGDWNKDFRQVATGFLDLDHFELA